jgi:hypothetical protein
MPLQIPPGVENKKKRTKLRTKRSGFGRLNVWDVMARFTSVAPLRTAPSANEVSRRKEKSSRMVS